ncbi:MAG: DUF2189 domain-containing protein, partial [Novosphingobium sp.]
MPTIPPVVPALPRPSPYARNLPLGSAINWLGAGWRDLWTTPGPSLAYGLAVFILSLGIVLGLILFGWDFALFPVAAGFLILGPILAIGLYAKSRALEEGQPVTLGRMILPDVPSVGQLLFTGAML